ncbi:MAG: hypothetical protein LW815_10380 [Chitinophagaceae bacterium]|nr:hypothetical protein [Chitinophagaceae bacterium]
MRRANVHLKSLCFLLFYGMMAWNPLMAQQEVRPDGIQFTRKAVRRFLFDKELSIPLSALHPNEIIGMPVMYPTAHRNADHATIQTSGHRLSLQSEKRSTTAIWFGGFNPFATYIIELDSCKGNGEIGFEFSDVDQKNQCIITTVFDDQHMVDTRIRIVKDSITIVEKSIALKAGEKNSIKGKIILQMLGSGLVLYLQNNDLPKPVAQCEISEYLDLRKVDCINTFQSRLFVSLEKGKVALEKIESSLSSGTGLADIRAITYENGDPLLDKGRLWYTMTIRGRGLPHPMQGVFSMSPSVFDIKMEGVIVFDRQDGLLRNEVASHVYFDRKDSIWRGLTTGFSAFANKKEKKQLLTIESKKDPRFGFSIMRATPFGMVGDYEDPHILFDAKAKKWRMLTCTNENGYKAIMLESDNWNKGYTKIAGPVASKRSWYTEDGSSAMG